MIKQIEEILTGVDSQKQSSFCGKVITPYDELKLHIKDIGDLKLPLKIRAIRSLIKHARPAKYGWKDQTLLDNKGEGCLGNSQESRQN